MTTLRDRSRFLYALPEERFASPSGSELSRAQRRVRVPVAKAHLTPTLSQRERGCRTLSSPEGPRGDAVAELVDSEEGGPMNAPS